MENNIKYYLGYAAYFAKRIHYTKNNVVKYIFKVAGAVKLAELLGHIYIIVTDDNFAVIRSTLSEGQVITDKIVIIEYAGNTTDRGLKVNLSVGWTFNDKKPREKSKFIKYLIKSIADLNSLSLARTQKLATESFVETKLFTIKVVDKSSIYSTKQINIELQSNLSKGR